VPKPTVPVALDPNPRRRAKLSEASAEEVLLRLGVDDLLEDVRQEALFQSEQLRTRWPDAEAVTHTLRSLAERAYATDSMKPVVAESFRRRAPEPDVSASIEFLRSPLWQEIRDLEQAARTSEGARAFQDFAASLQKEPPSERQQEIVQRVDEALWMSRIHVELQLEVLTALLEGVRRLVPEKSDLTKEEADRWIADARGSLTRNAEVAAQTTVLFQFRSLSDAELLECSEFWESDAGRSLREAAFGSVLDGLRVAAARLDLLLAGEPRTGDPVALAPTDPAP
jgi:hypothetical protein